MKSLPLPIRVAAGLAATAVDRATKLPEEIAGLPVTVASQALQLSMRVQQHVTELAIRGDEALAGLRRVEDKPDWATFDEDEDDGSGGATVHDFLRREAAAADRPVGTGRETHAAVTETGTITAVPRPSAVDSAPAEETAEPVESVEPEQRKHTLTRPRPTDLRRPESGSPPPAPVASTAAPIAEAAAEAAAKNVADTAVTEATPDTVPDTPRATTRPAADDTRTAARKPTGAVAAASTAAPGGLAGFDEMSVAQVRGHLRTLSVAQLEELLAHERSHGARERVVTMLSNRVRTVRAAED